MTNFEDSPIVGKLMVEDNPKKGSLELFYVDEAPDPESPNVWPYTDIALMDEFDEGQGIQVYTGLEAGMTNPENKRYATDEDITKIVKTKLEIEGDSGIGNLANWFNGLMTEQDCENLLASEKERISKLIEQVISEVKGGEGLKQYNSLLGLPYKSEN